MICKRALIAGTLLLALGLTCWLVPIDGSEPTPAVPVKPTLPENVWVEHLPVDGQLVPCVLYSAYGIDCNWAAARPLDAGMTNPSIAARPS